MITLTPILNDAVALPLYQQLYRYIKEAIGKEDILPGEKLPSLRSLSRSLRVSVTTIELAYDQLLVEGYIESRPQSGYYVNDIRATGTITSNGPLPSTNHPEPASWTWSTYDGSPLYYDPASFDMQKWKKCFNTILNEHSAALFQEGDPRGEAPLRHEISKYVYQARGVRCFRDQVIIGAGTQQLINLLSIILRRMGIDHASFEDPGYRPVRGIFADRGFKLTDVPIDRDGILIDKLPANIRSTVYVSPSNQFPTGSVMPIARRYDLLRWAEVNNSIIIEDDYNSELRYAGRPVPSLQGLDERDSVVYLGSFSSTLFPSIKISYMVLPEPMLQLFEEVLSGYTQTCSKAEQLTLALFMQSGLYQTSLRKLRKLYSLKIQKATLTIENLLSDRVRILNNSSGLHMLLGLRKPVSDEGLLAICQQAKSYGLLLSPVLGPKQDPVSVVIFYYTRIPVDGMEEAILALGQAIDHAPINEKKENL